MIAVALFKGYCVGFGLFLVANLFMMRYDKSKEAKRERLLSELQNEVHKIGGGNNAVAFVLALSVLIYSALWFVYIPQILFGKRKH